LKKLVVLPEIGTAGAETREGKFKNTFTGLCTKRKKGRKETLTEENSGQKKTKRDLKEPRKRAKT